MAAPRCFGNTAPVMEPLHELARDAAGGLVRRPALWLLALATAACAPLLAGGVQWGHDLRSHLLWSHHFERQLAAGELYPRWLVDVGDGFGGPVFFFYPPLTYYLIAALAPLLPDALELPWRLAVVGWLAVLASGLAFHRWLRRHVPGNAAFLGAALYMLFPYHLLFDFHLRVALAELVAFVFPPLLLLAVDEAEAHPPRALALGSGAWALLLLTHAPTALTAAPLPLVWSALRAARTRSAAPPALAAAQLAFGAGLAAAYLATALTHGPYIDESRLFGGRYHYASWFVSLRPESAWLALVYANGVVLTAACLAASGLAASTRRRVAKPRAAAALVHLSAAGALVYLLLMLPASAPLWEHLPLLHKVQFPWRLNAQIGLLASLCAAALAAHLAAALPRRRPALARGGAALVALLLAAHLAAASRTRELFDARHVPLTKQGLAALLRPGPLPREYFRVPRERDPRALLPGGARVAFAAGSGDARVEEWRPRRLVLSVRASEPARLALRQQFYPGWRARLEGAPGDARLDALRREYGILALDLPPGSHRITLTLAWTPRERLGWIASAASLPLLAGATGGLAVRRRRAIRAALSR